MTTLRIPIIASLTLLIFLLPANPADSFSLDLGLCASAGYTAIDFEAASDYPDSTLADNHSAWRWGGICVEKDEVIILYGFKTSCLPHYVVHHGPLRQIHDFGKFFYGYISPAVITREPEEIRP